MLYTIMHYVELFIGIFMKGTGYTNIVSKVLLDFHHFSIIDSSDTLVIQIQKWIGYRKGLALVIIALKI